MFMVNRKMVVGSIFAFGVLGSSVASPAGAQSRDLIIEELRDNRTTLWVLAIGVSRYEDASISLEYADYDALQIAQVLETQEGLLFDEVKTRVLVNEDATRESILGAISTFLSQASQDDVVLIFLSGHGLQDGLTETYYFVPHDANARNLLVEGLSMPVFDEACTRIRQNVSKLVLWLDTCHSGAVSVGARGGISAGEDLSAALREAEGQYWLAASRAGEQAFENERFRFEGDDRSVTGPSALVSYGAYPERQLTTMESYG